MTISKEGYYFLPKKDKSMHSQLDCNSVALLNFYIILLINRDPI